MKNSNLLLLWTGKLVSGLGDKLYAIAIAWWILEVTNSTVMMGLYLVIATLPMVIMGIVAGAVIDKSNLKQVLVVADVIRGIGILLIGLLYVYDYLTVTFVFLITVILSIASAFFNPAVTTIIPRIVHQKEYNKANSTIQFVDGIAKLLGPIAGVAAVASIGYFGAFLINGVSFLISAFFESYMRFGQKIDKKSMVSIKYSELLKEIQVGLQYVWNNSKLKNILFYVFVAHLFYSAIVIMMPYLAKFESNDNLNLLGILETVFGAGFVIGAFAIPKMKGNLFDIKALPKLFTIMGSGIIILGIITWVNSFSIISSAIPIFLIGFCIVIASIIWQTFLQTDTPKEKLGRVSSIASLIGDITMPIGFAIYGILLDKIDFVTIALVSGIFLIVAIMIIRYNYKRKIVTQYSIN